MFLRRPRSTLFPYTTLFRSGEVFRKHKFDIDGERFSKIIREEQEDYINRMQCPPNTAKNEALLENVLDRKSTRLNSSHSQISYAVFCLKKKKKNQQQDTTNQ